MKKLMTLVICSMLMSWQKGAISGYVNMQRVHLNGESVIDTSKRKPKAAVLLYHRTYKDFQKGSFSDAGANLYLSKKGNIQFINLFDLDADGFPEAIFNNDHNHHESPDILVYHNKSPHGLKSLTNPNAADAPAYQNLAWTMESLASITRLPTEGGGKSVLTDLNGDGHKDLVFANFIHGSTLAEIPGYIYWGGTDGLNPARRSLLPADRGTAVAVEDLTGDGLLDIVVANAGREHLGLETPDFSHDFLAMHGGPREKSSYFFPQGEAGFTTKDREVIPTQFAVDVKIADLDNDGSKEVIFLELGAPGALRIVQRKDGKWIQQVLIPVIAPKPLNRGKRIYQEILVQDLDADGYADIFAPSSGSKSEIFWNRAGKISPDNKTILDTENAMSAAAADLNRDGYMDLVVANFYSSEKNGLLQFETNSYIWWGAKHGFNRSYKTPLPTMGAVSVRLADVNNSGFQDVIFAQHRNQETLDVPSYIYVNSSGTFSPAARIDLQGFGAVNVVAEDLDGDNRKEILLVNSMSGKARHSGIEDGAGNDSVSVNGLPMYIYRGNANRNYNVANLIRIPESSGETNMAFADLEDNGKASLVHLRGGGFRVCIRYDILNYPKTKELSEIDLPFRANTVNVADFDKDGTLDIFVTPITGPQAVLLFGLGNRKYKSEIFDFPHYAYSCSIGDVNSDGVLDAVTSSHKEICILLGQREGNKFSFHKPSVITTDVLTTRVSMADFNKDGWLDILCQNLQNTYTKIYDIESWVLINDRGKFSLENKRAFKTFGANGGSIAQLRDNAPPQILISNYHADASRRVGTFVMADGQDGFPIEEGKTRLPSMSAGANMVLDFDADGFQDILVFNHTGNDLYNGAMTPTGGIHGIGSYLYWGSKDGYGMKERTSIPSFGPHSRIMADPGSSARRYSYEIYSSPFVTNNSDTENFVMIISGRFNRRQNVKPEIEIEGSSVKVMPGQLMSDSTRVVYKVQIPKQKKFKYHLQLDGRHSGNGPLVSSVLIEKAEY